MQVSQSTDYVTHASIGAGQVESFQIAQSAEFFQVLSSALYTHKKLAVVREVLCNAWDAHIAAGCTDIPIQVTLTDDMLTIKDFGTGIAPDKIVEIYGTYGQSTKLHDGTQTGGFGLGSKAPFAYTDHFEVTSCHAGTKTIYNMSLSSAVAGGKPSIQTILSLKTDDTGIAVSIGLKDQRDRYDFKCIIQKIVFNGDMNVELNGKLCAKSGMSDLPDAFCIIPSSNSNNAGLHIRYGNVIYPVESDAHYVPDLNWASSFINSLNPAYSWGDCCLILQADPHSISVTPSREALSMTEKTITSIGKLLKQFRAKVESCLGLNAEAWIKDGISNLWLEHDISSLWDIDSAWPHVKSPRSVEKFFVSSFEQLVKLYLGSSKGKSQYHAISVNARLEAWIESGMDTSRLASAFLRQPRSTYAPTWFKDALAKPLIKGLAKHPTLKPESLKLRIPRSRWSYGGREFVGLLTNLDVSNEVGLKLVRGFVVITASRTAVSDRLYNFPEMKHLYGSDVWLLTYFVSRKTQEAQEARKFFEARGFKVIDLTVTRHWEKRSTASPAPKSISPKIPDTCLSAAIYNGSISTLRLRDPAYTKPISNPEFVVVMTQTQAERGSFEGLDPTNASRVIELYGGKGVVVTSSSKAMKYKKRGIPSLAEWLPTVVASSVKNNANFKSRIAIEKSLESINWTSNAYSSFRVIRKDDEMAKHYGIFIDTSDEETSLYRLFNYLLSKNRKECEVVYDETRANVGTHPEADKLIQALQNSASAYLIDWAVIRNHIDYGWTNPGIEKVREFITNNVKV